VTASLEAIGASSPSGARLDHFRSGASSEPQFHRACSLVVAR
jgi:hypothetical protein